MEITITSKPKFYIGEIVSTKLFPKGTLFHIHDILIQKCVGGEQISYIGRLLIKEDGRLATNNISVVVKMSEIELEKRPD